MQRHRLVIVGVLGAALTAWSQGAQQAPPTGTQSSTGAGAEKSTMGPGMHEGAAHGMKSGAQGQMHAQHMQEVQQSIAKMRGLLEQMKSNAAGLSGKDKAAMDANVQLWQMMIDHMDQMAQHMSSMEGHGSMQMHHGGMHGMQGQGSTQGPTSSAPAPPDKDNPTPPPQR